jgi:hypothetical protein
MEFNTSLPTTFIQHSYFSHGRREVHPFGITDMNGILTVSDDDKYIELLKAKFSVIENDIPQVNETIGEEIKSNTTPITGDTNKGGKLNERKCTAGSHPSTEFVRSRTTSSNTQHNGKNSSGRGTKGTKHS